MNNFGSGDGKGSYGFGGPPGGPITTDGGGGFGEPEHCNLQVSLTIKIRHGQAQVPTLVGTLPISRTTMQVTLYVNTLCEKKAVETKSLMYVTQTPLGGSRGVSVADPKNKDICEAFDGIEITKMVDPDDLTKLFKDLSNETSELPGFEFSKFMKSLCSNSGAGGRARYDLTLICSRNIGICEEKGSQSYVSDIFGAATASPVKCNEKLEIFIDIPGPINIPWDYIGPRKADINPCKLSALLDCWEAHPDASTTIPIGNQASIGSGLTANPLPQSNINEAADKTLDVLKSKCDAASRR